ncbi:MAG TPA: hypothetical protein P5572_03680 [Phycisphaerae bacterium]|nr:hypothetical protein [Phycisphaerae bacterium]
MPAPESDGPDEGRPPNARRSRRKYRWISWGALGAAILLGIFNLTPLPVVLGLKPIIHVYWYESSDGGFRDMECPEKGRELDFVQRVFSKYQEQCGHEDAVLYRTHPCQPWKFWNWGDYLLHPRWRLPYRASQVQKDHRPEPRTPGIPCPVN